MACSMTYSTLFFLGAGRHRAVCGEAGDCEDRALGRLHHRVVGSALTPSCMAAAKVQPSAVTQPLRLLDIPRKSSERMTPELPRAPRSRALAVMDEARSTVAGLRFLQLRRGVHGQAHIGARVAVRHGENVEIVDALFSLAIEAAPKISISWKTGPVMVSCIGKVPPLVYMVMLSTQTFTPRTTAPVFSVTR